MKSSHLIYFSAIVLSAGIITKSSLLAIGYTLVFSGLVYLMAYLAYTIKQSK